MLKIGSSITFSCLFFVLPFFFSLFVQLFSSLHACWFSLSLFQVFQGHPWLLPVECLEDEMKSTEGRKKEHTDPESQSVIIISEESTEATSRRNVSKGVAQNTALPQRRKSSLCSRPPFCGLGMPKLITMALNEQLLVELRKLPIFIPTAKLCLQTMTFWRSDSALSAIMQWQFWFCVVGLWTWSVLVLFPFTCHNLLFFYLVCFSPLSMGLLFLTNGVVRKGTSSFEFRRH